MCGWDVGTFGGDELRRWFLSEPVPSISRRSALVPSHLFAEAVVVADMWALDLLMDRPIRLSSVFVV